jgi:hypothetical protein
MNVIVITQYMYTVSHRSITVTDTAKTRHQQHVNNGKMNINT